MFPNQSTPRARWDSCGEELDPRLHQAPVSLLVEEHLACSAGAFWCEPPPLPYCLQWASLRTCHVPTCPWSPTQLLHIYNICIYIYVCIYGCKSGIVDKQQSFLDNFQVSIELPSGNLFLLDVPTLKPGQPNEPVVPRYRLRISTLRTFGTD